MEGRVKGDKESMEWGGEKRSKAGEEDEIRLRMFPAWLISLVRNWNHTHKKMQKYEINFILQFKSVHIHQLIERFGEHLHPVVFSWSSFKIALAIMSLRCQYAKSGLGLWLHTNRKCRKWPWWRGKSKCI